MKRLRSFIFVIALLFSCGFAAKALTVKPNIGPVVQAPIAAYDQLLQTKRVIDLSPFFRDPDASAAARVVTPLGTMNFTLDGETAPITVANFLNYVNSGRYAMTATTPSTAVPTIFHRSAYVGAHPFVIQGGGFLNTGNPNGDANPTAVAAFPQIQNEPVISNTRGTIAMAKVGGQPNSATSQWFINMMDNSGTPPNGLDFQNEGFTVFGHVGGAGMAVADAIAALQRLHFNPPFDDIPVRDYISGTVKTNNIVTAEITQISPFTFSATSDNPLVADVIVSGTNLIVESKGIGSTQINVTATDLDGLSVAQSFTVNVIFAPGRLLNIATRAAIGVDDNVLIAGFIIAGGTSKKLVIRGIGPSLGNLGIANALQNPTLELLDDTGSIIASNDNWGDAASRQELIDLDFDPTAPNESAMVVTVPSDAGTKAYTAIVRGVNATTGVGTVEVYDLDSEAGSTILNLSSRARVGTGAEVMIGGLIVGGGDARRIIIRSLGPTLAQRGVSGTLGNPALELYDAQGTLLESNNDWQQHPNANEIQTLGFAPNDPVEPALIRTFPAGAYTAIVSGEGDTTGVATVEAYQVQ